MPDIRLPPNCRVVRAVSEDIVGSELVNLLFVKVKLDRLRMSLTLENIRPAKPLSAILNVMSDVSS